MTALGKLRVCPGTLEHLDFRSHTVQPAGVAVGWAWIIIRNVAIEHMQHRGASA